MSDVELDLDAIVARAMDCSARGPWHLVQGPPACIPTSSLTMCVDAAVYAVRVPSAAILLSSGAPRAEAAHIAGMDPATTLALVQRLRDAEAAVERMRRTESEWLHSLRVSAEAVERLQQELDRVRSELEVFENVDFPLGEDN